MTGTAASRARGGPMPSANSPDALTDVELTWIERQNRILDPLRPPGR